MKLSNGEFSKDEKTTARNMFFRSIQEEAPHVISSIESDLYPQYVKAFPEHDAKRYLHVKNNHSPEAHMFYNALNSWCKKYGLEHVWAMDRIIFILSSWDKKYIERENGERLPRRGRIHSLPGNENIDNISEIKPIIPELEPWNAWFEKEEEFRQRVEGYIEKVKGIYREANWNEPLIKRDRGAGPLIHIRWLVQKLFLGKEVEDIAQEYMDSDPSGELEISNDAVRKALSNASKMIGL